MNMDILCFASDASTACTVEAIRGPTKPFDPRRIHNSDLIPVKLCQKLGFRHSR